VAKKGEATKVISKEDNLRFKPNILSLAEEGKRGAQVEDMRSDEDSEEVQEGDEMESEIEDDMGEQKVGKQVKKGRKEEESDGEAGKRDKGVYKVKKLNPIMYEDKASKAAKQAERQERHQKNKLSKSAYV
jgi:hypothetical protein